MTASPDPEAISVQGNIRAKAEERLNAKRPNLKLA
jgi:hypothetical protein